MKIVHLSLRIVLIGFGSIRAGPPEKELKLSKVYDKRVEVYLHVLAVWQSPCVE